MNPAEYDKSRRANNRYEALMRNDGKWPVRHVHVDAADPGSSARPRPRP